MNLGLWVMLYCHIQQYFMHINYGDKFYQWNKLAMEQLDKTIDLPHKSLADFITKSCITVQEPVRLKSLIDVLICKLHYGFGGIRLLTLSWQVRFPMFSLNSNNLYVQKQNAYDCLMQGLHLCFFNVLTLQRHIYHFNRFF